MNDWIKKQFDNGFTDLQGLSIKAEIPVKDRLVNELLAEVLNATPPPAGSTAPATPDVDFRRLLKFVEKAEVRATEGTITLDVAIKI